MSTTRLSAQTYKQMLEPVWITNTSTQLTEDVVITTNEQILNENTFKLNREIRVARKNLNEHELIKSDHVVELSRYQYLITLKRAANRSNNQNEFKSFLLDTLPVLEPVFEDIDQVDDLYAAIRKDTFNGRLEALPSVL